MQERTVMRALAQYAVLAVGQAVIGFAVQQGVARATYELEQRKKRKRKVGF